VYDGERENEVTSSNGQCALKGGALAYAVESAPTWQRDVLMAMNGVGARVSLRTANGSGKTSTIVTALILWHLAMFPKGLVISTAGVDRQVRAQLWPQLRRHHERFPGWVFAESTLSIENPRNGSRYVGFTTDKPERAEGWHGFDSEGARQSGAIRELADAHAGPLMIIVDEAKGVPNGIFEAFDRCTYQRLLYCSSPGLSDGDFYRSQVSDKSPFRKFVVGAWNCPHADHAKNAEVIAKRGLDHPLVRSSIFAEFMQNDGSFVVTVSDLDRCIANPPVRSETGAGFAFCDFARGGDENVLAVRRGNVVRIVDAWREVDSMSAAARFVRLFRQHGLAAENITGDNGGLGGAVIDKLAELGWRINRANNGAAPEGADGYFSAEEKGKYANWGSETWHEAAVRIRDRDIILEGLDDETRAQMLSRKLCVDAKGRLGVESKEDMRKRGVSSPDRADALFGAMRVPRSFAPKQFTGPSARDEERESLAGWASGQGIQMGDPEEASLEILAGCRC
jgi:hypothetical protein